jgi:hypothetical protein
MSVPLEERTQEGGLKPPLQRKECGKEKTRTLKTDPSKLRARGSGAHKKESKSAGQRPALPRQTDVLDVEEGLVQVGDYVVYVLYAYA